MTGERDLAVLPYSAIVGQAAVKQALEIAFVAPRVGGVLLSGQRGTAKSTAVRAFAQMANGKLPLTLPINATDDRVVGGWRMDALMEGKPVLQPGLLEEAADPEKGNGLLYVDEVNLLDDHIVNLILDVASTGILSVQREMLNREAVRVSFTLVGTMNPEEGGLRPQLLDRFGLMVDVQAANKASERRDILAAVLAFDEARATKRATRWLQRRRAADQERCEQLRAARMRVPGVTVPKAIVQRCARLGEALELAGHRGEYVTVLAARALAALDSADEVALDHVMTAAPMALAHRSQTAAEGGHALWTDEQQAKLESALGRG